VAVTTAPVAVFVTWNNAQAIPSFETSKVALDWRGFFYKKLDAPGFGFAFSRLNPGKSKLRVNPLKSVQSAFPSTENDQSMRS
jgi:hypothetical protein